MKDLRSRPSQLWEQWLSRLHGIEEPQKNYYRLELIGLLSRGQSGDAETFVNRLGTILCHSLSHGEVLVINISSNKIAYSSNKTRGKLSGKLAKLVNKSAGLTIKNFARGSKVSHNQVIKTICQLPVTCQPGEEFRLIILLPDGLSVQDRHFLQFIAGILGLADKQRQTEQQLAQEQRLLGLLTQHINEGLVLLSDGLRVKIWNRPLQRITGFSPKEAVGKTYQEIINFPDNPEWLDKLSDQYNNIDQSGFVFDGQIQTKAKQLRWVSVSGSFLRNSKGEVEQIIAIVRDISKQKELEQRKNEFISIATHELRTPITAIKGYLSLLKNHPDSLTAKQSSYLESAYLATERLVGLAEDLLQVIRVDEDRMKFNPRVIELTKIIEKVSRDFSQTARQKGLEFSLTLPPFDTTIVADPIRLEQVFANLVDNAIKYTSRGSISIAFEHYSEKLTKEDKVTVIIKDSGIGIDGKDLDGIFEKFHRSEKAATTAEPGAGLGLYIVKSFIEKQGGKITVKSRPKRGSVFAVTFPIAEVRLRSSMVETK